MKKGFTLVELLGVFAIISMIVLLAVPSVTNMLKQSEQDQYENFENDIFLATEAYLSSNSDIYLELKEINKTTYVTIKTLLYSDYLDSTLKNPKTGDTLYAANEYNKIILVKMNDKKMWEFELYGDEEDETLTSEQSSVITAYDSLTRNSTDAEVNVVQTQVESLPDSIIKTALQNRIEYR